MSKWGTSEIFESTLSLNTKIFQSTFVWLQEVRNNSFQLISHHHSKIYFFQTMIQKHPHDGSWVGSFLASKKSAEKNQQRNHQTGDAIFLLCKVISNWNLIFWYRMLLRWEWLSKAQWYFFLIVFLFGWSPHYDSRSFCSHFRLLWEERGCTMYRGWGKGEGEI